MVQRAILTKRVVDEADAPDTREVWIADTQTRGFGLRVWRNRTGDVGKAYCVRIRDAKGRLQRRTFDPWGDLGWYYWERFFLDGEATLGDLSEFARNWARDQIDALKRHPALDKEIQRNRQALGKQLGRTRLGRAMEAYLTGRQLEGLTEAHLDRLDKLFSRYVPKEVQQTPIKEVTPKVLRAIFENTSLSPSNLRVLRPLLKDLFRRYQVFAGGSNAAEKAADLLPVTGYGDWPEKSKYLPVWTESKFQNFFKWLLEKNDDYWQQALCLRLFFRVDQVPLTRTLSATWDQFYMVNVSLSFGSNQTEKKPAWYWSDKHWLRHVFHDSDFAFIAELLRRQSPSPYLFPSPHGRSVGHIRTVDHVWRNALAEFKLPYASPREFKSLQSSQS